MKKRNDNRKEPSLSPTKPSAAQALKDVGKNPPSNTDPLGSYTGVPEDPKECPTQDADDL